MFHWSSSSIRHLIVLLPYMRWTIAWTWLVLLITMRKIILPDFLVNYSLIYASLFLSHGNLLNWWSIWGISKKGWTYQVQEHGLSIKLILTWFHLLNNTIEPFAKVFWLKMCACFGTGVFLTSVVICIYTFVVIEINVVDVIWILLNSIFSALKITMGNVSNKGWRINIIFCKYLCKLTLVKYLWQILELFIRVILHLKFLKFNDYVQIRF